MRYSLDDVCRETGLSPHSVRVCMRHRSIIPERQAHNRRKYDLSSADVAAIREAARELWPDATQPSATSGHLDGDIRALIDTLRARINTLERRMNALETRQHAPALPSAYTPAVPRETPPAPSYVRASLDDVTGEMFPQSLRGKGEWVELHGGPGRHYVREWREARDWHSAADAIRDVRARGWPDFMRERDTTDSATPQPAVETG